MKPITRIRIVRLFVAATVAVIVSSGATLAPAQRAAWTTSRFAGTPEPPPPYKVEVAFEYLKFKQPVTLTNSPNTSRLFVVQLDGKVFSFDEEPDVRSADLFFDLKLVVPKLAATYGMTFHPRFPDEPYVYLCYVLPGEDPDGSVISRFTVQNTDPPTVDAASEQVLLRWKAGGHNGCSLKFGPDGYLYISTGDGTGPNPPDTLMAGQDLTNLLSCILRIDVERGEGERNYAIPPDNPFVTLPGARPEIWAYGFRNPWKMSFDRATGDLWVGDVGWDTWELVYRVQRAGNYGWSITEGSQPIHPDAQRGPTPILPPVTQHDHSEAHSITGGFVYRGTQHEELVGMYIYGDYSTGKIWGLRYDGEQVIERKELADTPLQIIAWGETNNGDLYLMDYERTNQIYRLVANEAENHADSFPRRLSETGLFASVADHAAAPGVLQYVVNAPYWADGHTAMRLLALPDVTKIGGKITDQWSFPDGTVAARTVLHTDDRRRLETQVLHKYAGTWHPYSYIWNDAQVDAELAPPEGSPLHLSRSQSLSYQVASRAECKLCHSIKHGAVLGLNLQQLLRPIATPRGQVDQIDHWRALDVFADADTPAQSFATALVDPYDESLNISARARSYLHVNCNHCHSPGGGGTSTMHLAYHLPLKRMGTIDTKPAQGSLGLRDARFITPGDPFRSVLFYRMAKVGPGRMPHIGSQRIDTVGLQLIHNWIAGMPMDDAHSNSTEQQAFDQLGQQHEAIASADRAELISRLLLSPQASLRLAWQLHSGGLTSAVHEEIVRQAIEHPAAHVPDLFEPFYPPHLRIKRLGAVFDPQVVLNLQGDAARGRQLFWYRDGLNCRICHRIHNAGGDVGPNLTTIGRKYPPAQMLETLAEPSANIDEQFRGHVVVTADGKTLSGRILERDDHHIVLLTVDNKRIRITTADVEEILPAETSLMPDQLLRELTPQQAADLLAYLKSLQ